MSSDQSTRADIYLLADSSAASPLNFCRKLIAKVYAMGMRVHVLCASEQESEQLSALIWNSGETSFLPNMVLTAQSASDSAMLEATPISIGPDSALAGHRDLVIYFAKAALSDANHSQFKRLAVIAANDPNELNFARQSYKMLKQNLPEVNIHDMRKKA